ncbi:hypothetical protein [Pararhodobacter zhoushanensis]|uniref:hypothetical protein n=1 Tax=Pararhodobacter zhoushanensis TaxID=2479545 RepID=UPI000F8DD0AF|nr:hypothetical protein [Pararhodobacter zhoushanensis]
MGAETTAIRRSSADDLALSPQQTPRSERASAEVIGRQWSDFFARFAHGPVAAPEQDTLPPPDRK